MKRNAFIKSGLMLGMFLSAVACGGPEPVENPNPNPVSEKPDNHNEALTLEGQMAPAAGVSVKGPVRLAVAWYPMMIEDSAGNAISKPGSITTTDVVAEGSFPASFHFSTSTPPPAEALVAVGQGTTAKAALGILLAYQDKNGNGKLDTIPTTGTPIDSVLGSSLSWFSDTSHLVIYVDSEQQLEPELKKGFNLLKVTGESSGVVPLTTPISLTLSGGPLLDMFVCEGAWNSGEVAIPEMCGLDFSQQYPGQD